MSAGDLLWWTWELLKGPTISSGFILALFIGFCVLFGFFKTKASAGRGASVIKSLDETITNKAFKYLAPGAPRGPADQLKAPELVEAAARRS